jgi:ABC-type sugar transport system substrate-binding protein/methyl-accepting chemotaxis protein
MQAEKTKTSRSLSATLAIAFLGLSAGVLLIATTAQSIFNFQTQQDAVASRQQLIAQDAANEVAGFIQNNFNILESAIKLGDLALTSPELQKTTLERVQSLDRAIRQLVLFDNQDRELVKVSRISQTAVEELAGRVNADLFAQVRQGERYISSVYIDDITSEPIVLMAVPATNIFGDFEGTLLAEINLKFMWDLVDQLAIGETGQAYVVDRQGNLLAVRDVTRVLRGDNVSNMAEVSEFISSNAILDETPADVSEGIDGKRAVITYVPLGVPDWAVVTELPVNEAYREVIQGIVVSVVVTLVMAALAGFIGVVVARRLAVPISKLTETATQIAGGKLDLDATVEGPTEIIRLSESFNSMTAQLRDFIASLEQRVIERTRALETSTEVSRRLSTILDQRDLVREVVEQVQTAFDYYHAQIYLFDENKENLIMSGGTGEAGRTMLEQGHSIPKGRGLVGRTADTNLPVLVPNVERSIGYEIITTDNVEDVFKRESSLAATKTWYAHHVSARFTDIQVFAKRVAQKKASGWQTPRLGYILYGLNDFLETMKTGAEEAAQTLGLDVEIASADFDPDRGIHLFREMIAKGKDGLIVTPHFPEKWIAPIQEAIEMNIPVLTANLRCPDSATSAWFGQDSYQSGLILSRQLQKSLTAAGKTGGEIVVASAREIQELHQRYAGFKRGLQGSAYTLSEFYGVPQEDQQNYIGWERLVKAHPAMVAAVGLASMDLPNLVKIKKQLNARWVAAGYDLTVEVLDGIRDGTAQVTIGQHPYLQGYLPVLALGQYFADGVPLKDWIIESWQSNPLLPLTRAEAAVPISIGENVLGVLDVQEDEIDGLTGTDLDLLTSIANQVAVGLQNARTYREAQQRADREALIGNINQQIQSTTSVEDALRVAVRELGRALGTNTIISLKEVSIGKDR